MARRTCTHPITPSLRAQLVAKNIHKCPACCIRLYVCEVEEVQVALERRNGIFESRLRARMASKHKDYSEKRIHKALLKRWALAKIGLDRHLRLFGALRAEKHEPRWGLQLDKAFELWEDVRDECCCVPGFVRIPEPIDSIGLVEKMETVQDGDYNLDQDTRSNEDDGDGGGWQTVKVKTRKGRLLPDETTAKATHEEDTNMETRDQNEAMQNSNVPPGIKRSSYWDGRNRFDLLHSIDLDDDRNKHTSPSPIAVRPPNLYPPTPKRKRPANPHSHKTVRIADQITLICEASTVAQLCLQPHSAYTTAETARKRSAFHRRSMHYKPGPWTASPGDENVDTSFFRTTWAAYEGVVGLQINSLPVLL